MLGTLVHWSHQFKPSVRARLFPWLREALEKEHRKNTMPKSQQGFIAVKALKNYFMALGDKFYPLMYPHRPRQTSQSTWTSRVSFEEDTSLDGAMESHAADSSRTRSTNGICLQLLESSHSDRPGSTPLCLYSSKMKSNKGN